MSLFEECRDLRNSSSPDVEKLERYFRKRTTLLKQMQVSDYLELSPLPWPRKYTYSDALSKQTRRVRRKTTGKV